MRLKLTLDEIGCICLMLFYGTMGYVPILMPNTGGALTNQSQMQDVHGLNHLILFLIWFGIFYLLLKSYFKLRLDLLSARAALAYAGFAFLSFLWSTNPASTFSGGVSLIFSTVFAIFLVTKFHGERLVNLLSWVMLVLSLGSAFLALVLPRYGLDHFMHSGAWQGLYGQKNGLGLVMVLGTGIVISQKRGNMVENSLKYLTLFLCIAEVGLSRSREAWIACALIVSMHFAFKVYERFALGSRLPVLLVGTVIILTVSGIVAVFWVEILTFFGRDVTLTGRTVLWQAVLEQCKNHPLTGYGLGSFWGTGAALPIYAKTGWTPTSSHNGFLECLLELGAIGLVLLLFPLLLGWYNAIKIVASHRNFDSSKAWIYCFAAITMLNMVGDITGNINSICWMIVLIGACALEADRRNAMLPSRRLPNIVSMKAVGIGIAF